MKPAGHYVVDAYGLTTDAFVAVHGRLFLVHTAPAEPAARDDSSDEWASAMA